MAAYKVNPDGSTTPLTNEEAGAALDVMRKETVIQPVEKARQAVIDAASKVPGAIWDSIPSWAKWGTLGAVVAYVAGPTIIESLIPRRRDGIAQDR